MRRWSLYGGSSQVLEHPRTEADPRYRAILAPSLILRWMDSLRAEKHGELNYSERTDGSWRPRPNHRPLAPQLLGFGIKENAPCDTRSKVTPPKRSRARLAAELDLKGIGS